VPQCLRAKPSTSLQASRRCKHHVAARLLNLNLRLKLQRQLYTTLAALTPTCDLRSPLRHRRSPAQAGQVGARALTRPSHRCTQVGLTVPSRPHVIVSLLCVLCGKYSSNSRRCKLRHPPSSIRHSTAGGVVSCSVSPSLLASLTPVQKTTSLQASRRCKHHVAARLLNLNSGILDPLYFNLSVATYFNSSAALHCPHHLFVPFGALLWANNFILNSLSVLCVLCGKSPTPL